MSALDTRLLPLALLAAVLLPQRAAAQPSQPTSAPRSRPTSAAASRPGAASRSASGRPRARAAEKRAPRRRAARSPRALSGTLAVVNLGRAGYGWRVAARIQRQLSRWIGERARQRGVAGHLAGKPNADVLPSGENGRALALLLPQLRGTARPSHSQLWRLGRLLGVDYLLLVAARKERAHVRLFSVHRQRYAPQSLHVAAGDARGVERYIAHQLRRKSRPAERREKPSLWRRKWWIWLLAAAVGAVTIGFAVAGKDDDAGPLRIRVTR